MSGTAVRAPGGGPRQDAPAIPPRAAAVAAGVLGLVALSIAVYAGVKGVAGVPDALRGVAGRRCCCSASRATRRRAC